MRGSVVGRGEERSAAGAQSLPTSTAPAGVTPSPLRPPALRPQIVASVCPELHGLFNVKLATLLMLIGGVARCDDGGTHIRGELHMLLVGDPGTGERGGRHRPPARLLPLRAALLFGGCCAGRRAGRGGGTLPHSFGGPVPPLAAGKSQFQKYVARLASRAVVTSGRASSAVGLTGGQRCGCALRSSQLQSGSCPLHHCPLPAAPPAPTPAAAAVHDGGGWTLEAGALVLADGGVCCIDEFDGIPEKDR